MHICKIYTAVNMCFCFFGVAITHLNWYTVYTYIIMQRGMPMKLTVIGGGGVRSMFLAKSIAQAAEELNIDKLVFMDTDSEKLRIYGGMAAKIVKLLCPKLKFSCTDNVVEAFIGADYVITAIRVGGDDMRVCDERTALSNGVIGQETTGAAGFSFAMRSIPALIEYCEYIKKYAKSDVKVFNFTNPAGLVSQALRDAGYDFTFGICDAPTSMLASFADLLSISPDEISGELFGLNHLSFFSSVTAGGRNILPKLIESDIAYERTDMRYFDKALLMKKQLIPNEYLYYYYSREKAFENINGASETRGEQIARLNKAMTAELADKDILNDFNGCLKIFDKYYGMRENSYMASETGVARNTEWHFNPFSKDTGGYAGVALKYIRLKASGKPGKMIMCVPNDGAVAFLKATDIVEVTCDVTPDGVFPHAFDITDEDTAELIRRMKLYERNAAAAILARDRDLAISALMLHPLIESYSLAVTLVDSYIELNKDYSDNWK